MALILKEKYIGVNGSYKLFITNRFLRIYPIYWTVLILTALYSVVILINSHGQILGNFTAYVKNFERLNLGSFAFLIFTNLFLFMQDCVLFLGLNNSGNLFFTANFRETNPMLYDFLFIPQAWTIGVELTFYLIAPFLVKRKLITIGFLIAVSVLVRFFLAQMGLTGDPWSYRFFPSELVFFLLGIVSYHVYTYLRTSADSHAYQKIILIFLAGFTLAFSLLPVPGKNYVYLFCFFMSLPFIFLLTKKWPVDKFIGDLSYPIYISHIFVMKCVLALKIPLIGGLGLVSSLATILFSIVLNEFVSKKIEKYRQRRVVQNMAFA